MTLHRIRDIEVGWMNRWMDGHFSQVRVIFFFLLLETVVKKEFYNSMRLLLYTMNSTVTQPIHRSVLLPNVVIFLFQHLYLLQTPFRKSPCMFPRVTPESTSTSALTFHPLDSRLFLITFIKSLCINSTPLHRSHSVFVSFSQFHVSYLVFGFDFAPFFLLCVVYAVFSRSRVSMYLPAGHF